MHISLISKLTVPSIDAHLEREYCLGAQKNTPDLCVLYKNIMNEVLTIGGLWFKTSTTLSLVAMDRWGRAQLVGRDGKGN